MYLPSFQDDNRYLFLIPWEGKILYGTTDTNYSEELDQVKTTKDDIHYLLKTLNICFPTVKIK